MVHVRRIFTREGLNKGFGYNSCITDRVIEAQERRPYICVDPENGYITVDCVYYIPWKKKFEELLDRSAKAESLGTEFYEEEMLEDMIYYRMAWNTVMSLKEAQ